MKTYSILSFVLLILIRGASVFSQNIVSKELTHDEAELINKATTLLDVNPSESIIYSRKAYLQAQIDGDTLQMSEALRLYAKASYSINNPDSAKGAVLKSIELVKNVYACQYALSLMTYADFLRLGGEPLKSIGMLKQSAQILFVCGSVDNFMNALYLLGQSYDMAGFETEAINTQNALLRLAKAHNNYFYQFKATNSLLIVFMKVGKSPIELFEQMMFAANKSEDPDLQTSAWNNMANYYASIGETDNSLFCYKNALDIAMKYDDNENIALISLNLVLYYVRHNEMETAEVYFENAQVRENYIVHFTWRSIYLGLKARFSERHGDMDLAAKELIEAIEINKNGHNYPNMISLCRYTASFFSRTGDFEKAYYYMQQVADLSDSLYILKGSKDENNLYYKVLLDLEKEKAQTIFLKNENLEKNRKISYLLLISALIMMILGGVVMYFLSNRFRQRILNAEQQKETLLAARIRLSNELKEKNKEIASFVLNQVMVNEHSNDVIAQLRQIGQRCPKDVQKKLFEQAGVLASTQNKNIWKEFDHYFRQVNPDFFLHLTSTHPDLTSRDLRYCALLSLQLSSKEMAMITGMTLQSIHVLRSRLRQKLSIEKDEDLGVYLSRFSSGNE